MKKIYFRIITHFIKKSNSKQKLINKRSKMNPQLQTVRTSRKMRGVRIALWAHTRGGGEGNWGGEGCMRRAIETPLAAGTENQWNSAKPGLIKCLDFYVFCKSICERRTSGEGKTQGRFVICARSIFVWETSFVL